MATVTRTTVWSDGNILTASALNGEFNNLLNAPAIMNADIAANAAIATSKISFAGTSGQVLESDGAGGISYVSGPSGTIVGNSDTQTLTNKRITKRVVSTTSSSSPTPNADTTDVYELTALASSATFGSPTGTPTDAQPLLIRIKDNGSGQTLAFNAIYRFSTDLPAPTTTVANKTFYLGFIYNSADTKWDCIAQLNNL